MSKSDSLDCVYSTRYTIRLRELGSAHDFAIDPFDVKGRILFECCQPFKKKIRISCALLAFFLVKNK